MATITYNGTTFAITNDDDRPINIASGATLLRCTWNRHSPSPFDRVAYALHQSLDHPTILATLTDTPSAILVLQAELTPTHKVLINLTPDLRCSTMVAAPHPDTKGMVESKFRKVFQLPAEGDPANLIAWIGLSLDKLAAKANAQEQRQAAFTEDGFQAHVSTKGTRTTAHLTLIRCEHDPRPLLVGVYSTDTPQPDPNQTAVDAIARLKLAINDLRHGQPPPAAPTLNRIICACPDGEAFTVNGNAWHLTTPPGKRGMPTLHCGDITIEPVKWDRQRSASTFKHDPAHWQWKLSTDQNTSRTYPHPFDAMKGVR